MKRHHLLIIFFSLLISCVQKINAQQFNFTERVKDSEVQFTVVIKNKVTKGNRIGYDVQIYNPRITAFYSGSKRFSGDDLAISNAELAKNGITYPQTSPDWYRLPISLNDLSVQFEGTINFENMSIPAFGLSSTTKRMVEGKTYTYEPWKEYVNQFETDGYNSGISASNKAIENYKNQSNTSFQIDKIVRVVYAQEVQAKINKGENIAYYLSKGRNKVNNNASYSNSGNQSNQPQQDEYENNSSSNKSISNNTSVTNQSQETTNPEQPEGEIKYKTPEEIRADYQEFVATNNQAESQMSGGDFLGAASTYANAGRELEAYGALGGHVVTQFAVLLANSRQVRIEKKENTLQDKLTNYDALTDEIIKLLNNNEVRMSMYKGKKLFELENSIMRDANWLGKKQDDKFYEVTKNLREKQLKRIALLLQFNTEEIITINKDTLFSDMVRLKHSEELKFQTFKVYGKKYDYNQEAYAKKIWALINRTQINRIKFLLELNKKDNIFDRYTEMILYLTNNYQDTEFDERSIETFRKLSKQDRDKAIYEIVKYNMPDGDMYYFRGSIVNIHKVGSFYDLSLNYNKLLLIINNCPDFNYYTNLEEYTGENEPFYEYLENRSGKINVFNSIKYFYADVYDSKIDNEEVAYTILKDKVDSDRKETGKREKELFKERQDCLTVDCE